MNNEDYFKYYIQGSDHYLIPKDIFDELFNELANWREESKELQERINKAIEYVENNPLYEEEYDYDYEENSYLSGVHDEIATKDLLKILRGEING